MNYDSTKRKEIYHSRKENGLCVWCGKINMTYRVHCDDCKPAHTMRINRCTRCRENEPNNGHPWCTKCRKEKIYGIG